MAKRQSTKTRSRARKPADKPAPAAEPSSEPTISRFERYEWIEVHRQELKNAPYNPRILSDKARQKLRRNLAKHGVVTAITWNRRSGNIVGGHQRISILDSLEGTKNYKLHVAAIDVDDKAERELNIFLNNEEAQGDFDLDKLHAMFADEEIKIDVEETGFNSADLYQMFGDNPLNQSPEELLAMSEKIKEARERHEEIFSDDDLKLKDQYDFYCVVVFSSDDECKQFLDTLDVADNRYVDGRELWQQLYANGALEPPDSDAPSDNLDGKAALGTVDSPSKIRETVTKCPRCGKDHLEMVFYPLARPGAGPNYWAFCPVACQPILIESQRFA